MSDIQQAIKKYRKEHGLSVSEAAKLARCSIRTWQRFENGKLGPEQINNAEARFELVQLKMGSKSKL